MTKAWIDINCDISEGFGTWMFGDDIDAQMMPMVSSVNVAAGFHAGDPNTMARTVSLAKEYGVGVGVHPGFRDLVGFGRRHINAGADELVNDSLYQLGALREFTRYHRIGLQHFKLQGPSSLAMRTRLGLPCDGSSASPQRPDQGQPKVRVLGPGRVVVGRSPTVGGLVGNLVTEHGENCSPATPTGRSRRAV